MVVVLFTLISLKFVFKNTSDVLESDTESDAQESDAQESVIPD